MGIGSEEGMLHAWWALIYYVLSMQDATILEFVGLILLRFCNNGDVKQFKIVAGGNCCTLLWADFGREHVVSGLGLAAGCRSEDSMKHGRSLKTSPNFWV
jgi:hypothetical protein